MLVNTAPGDILIMDQCSRRYVKAYGLHGNSHGINMVTLLIASHRRNYVFIS